MDDILGPMGLDRDYLRVKVDVNTNYPILTGIWYTQSNGEKGRAEIRYERLPKFCFGCGKIGHSERGCSSEIAIAETEEGGPMYGIWTMVDRSKRRGRNVEL